MRKLYHDAWLEITDEILTLWDYQMARWFGEEKKGDKCHRYFRWRGTTYYIPKRG